MKTTKSHQLEREWSVLYVLFKNDTLKAYNHSVRGGNTQTYSQFVNDIKKDWMKEMSGRR